jgi:hypothetical protein
MKKKKKKVGTLPIVRAPLDPFADGASPFDPFDGSLLLAPIVIGRPAA